MVVYREDVRVWYSQDFYGGLERRWVGGHIPLHISYRSIDQFLDGIGNGDTVSETVLQYGVPIINKERFEEIAERVTVPARKPLHRIKWRQNLGQRAGLIDAKIF